MMLEGITALLHALGITSVTEALLVIGVVILFLAEVNRGRKEEGEKAETALMGELVKMTGKTIDTNDKIAEAIQQGADANVQAAQTLDRLTGAIETQGQTLGTVRQDLVEGFESADIVIREIMAPVTLQLGEIMHSVDVICQALDRVASVPQLEALAAEIAERQLMIKEGIEAIRHDYLALHQAYNPPVDQAAGELPAEVNEDPDQGIEEKDV